MSVRGQPIVTDIDESQALNGTHQIIVLSKKRTNKSNEKFLLNHVLKHSTIYIVLLSILFIIVTYFSVRAIYNGLHQNNKVEQTKRIEQRADQLRQKLSPERIKQLEKEGDPEQQISQLLNIKDLEKTDIDQLNLLTQEKVSQLFSKIAGTTGVDSGQKPKIIIKHSRQAIKPSDPSKAELKPVIDPVKQAAQQKRASRPIAGINPQQKQTAKRWLQLKNQNISQTSQLAKQQYNYYQQKYNISQYEEQPFCIVVPSYNNAKNELHYKNMRSILMQNYTNYHIVFIDDASNDTTATDIENFLKNDQDRINASRYVIIRNQQQKRAMPNIRRAAKEFCRPQDIFLVVDGDDQLLGRQVLKLFNAVFQKQKAWFVYSNFLSIRFSVGYSRPFPKQTIRLNKFRSYPFVTSHLRAFYTQLFLNIKQQDLKDNQGNYLKAANDVAICLPILQMAHQRVFYLPELTYYYNSNTGQNNHRLRLREQKGNMRMIKARPKYEPLEELFPKK